MMRDESLESRKMLLEKNFTPDAIAVLLRFAREKGGIEYAEVCMNGFREQATDVDATACRSRPCIPVQSSQSL
jgi:hypothetical protein